MNVRRILPPAPRAGRLLIPGIVALSSAWQPLHADPARASNRLGIELYGALRNPSENLCLSPHSVFTTLAMVSTGARDDTRREMDSVLYGTAPVPDDGPARIRAMHQAMREGLDDSLLVLTQANAAFVQEGMPIDPAFQEGLITAFQAGFDALPFKTDPESARATINDWADRHTAGRIPSIIPQGGLTEETRLVLANALYFKGAWVQAFDPRRTQPLPFRLATGAETPVPMMQNQAYYSYARNDMSELLELHYKGGDLSLVVILPRERGGLPALESALTLDRLTDWIADLAGREVVVFLPRFTIGTSATLNQPLQALGMKRAFSRQADFSGIAGAPGDLCVSDVFHRTWIEVNEVGTEAAAVTALSLRATSMPAEPPPVFRADHPFLFVLRSRKTGLFLFVGRVAEPERASGAP